MRFRLMSAVLGLLSVVLLSGCTTTSQGEPGAATTGTAGTATTGSTPDSPTGDPNGDLPTDGAPDVSNPLDTTAFQEDPCKALTASQTQGLNVPSTGEQYDDSLGNGCKWTNAETHGETIIGFLDKDPRGLSAVYKANEQGKWAYFEELSPVEGYPAVARSQSDERADGYCSVVIGASNEVAFDVYLRLSQANIGNRNPCEVATQVAGMALQTMKKGG